LDLFGFILSIRKLKRKTFANVVCAAAASAFGRKWSSAVQADLLLDGTNPVRNVHDSALGRFTC
jgi:hypothetical protein